MPVEFLTDEQVAEYGRFARPPSRSELERFFLLNDRDRELVKQRRRPHNRLGFAIQLGTVRFLGTFLPNPLDVPTEVLVYQAGQHGVRYWSASPTGEVTGDSTSNQTVRPGAEEMKRMPESNGKIKVYPVVSHDAWLAARSAFLTTEKEFTRARDKLSRQRRELPWEKVEREYSFESPNGPESLAGLFDDCSQLIVYHFMFPPEWDEGCVHCSYWADNFNGTDVHLRARDVSFAAVSRAPIEKIEAFKQRMGWSFRWVSSYRSDFNYDYQASFTPDQVESGARVFNFSTLAPGMSDREGMSAFYKDTDGTVFHTYSTYGRGIDILNGAYNFIDLTARGRDEDALSGPQDWVRYHDRYGD
jgi:predicted dithiol-disulfide oxidoreductase (DUF899 family)